MVDRIETKAHQSASTLGVATIITSIKLEKIPQRLPNLFKSVFIYSDLFEYFTFGNEK